MTSTIKDCRADFNMRILLYTNIDQIGTGLDACFRIGQITDTIKQGPAAAQGLFVTRTVSTAVVDPVGLHLVITHDDEDRIRQVYISI